MTPREHLLSLLEASKAAALSQVEGAEAYAITQLRRHIHAMDQQIAVVNRTAIYDRKGRQK